MKFNWQSQKSQNPLRNYFEANDRHLMNKWLHYFDIYHQYLREFRNKEITLLEFGVSHGGSLQMWKDYFGKKARIIGVDVLEECKKLEEKQIEIVIGDQENRTFLRKLVNDVGPIDIVIEDGGHEMKQQIHTFEEVFPHVKTGGIYIAEDLHTSYWQRFGGKYKADHTFIEYSKGLIDDMNAWHAEDKRHTLTPFTEMIGAMHIYDSVIVFEKAERAAPQAKKTGHKTVNQ
jgi:23S rRNA U2552 (ribose-2'-O)-methylase RlmE/FtsJ